MPGRKRGVPNKASAAREQRWSEQGKTPLDVMQLAMNHFAKRAEDLMGADVSRMTRKQRADHDRRLDDAIRSASGMAEKAAPYVHPRLTTTKHQGDAKRPIHVTMEYV